MKKLKVKKEGQLLYTFTANHWKTFLMGIKLGMLLGSISSFIKGKK